MSADALGLWLDAAGRNPIPSYSEQVQLGIAIQRMQHPDATAREQKVGQRALNRLVSGNLRLVVPIARKYRRAIEGAGCSIELIDLLQEGAIGLQTAARKFDPTRGYRFSTMAYWWIQQAIQKVIQTQRGAFRIPLAAQDLSRRWAQRGEQTLEEFIAAWPQHNYTAEKIAEAIEMTGMLAGVRSLDAKVHEGGTDGCSLAELIAAPQVDTLDELFYVTTVEQLRSDPATSDAFAALELAQTAKQSEMALLLDVAPKKVYKRLEDMRAVIREHLLNPCDNAPSKIEAMPAAMPTSNGHAELERLIDSVQAEEQPAPKAKRTRRTKQEIEAERAERGPALITIVLDGHDVTGTPQDLAALLAAMPARVVA